MDKETFCTILQCALLNFDGVDEGKLVEDGFERRLARAGIALTNYLKDLPY